MGKGVSLNFFSMSLLRTMSTRELEKVTSIVTSQNHPEPLSHEILLSIPDLRLNIGSQIPIPFEKDPLIPYVGDNTFGRKRERYHDVMTPSNEGVKPFWCAYCGCTTVKPAKHSKTHKCQKAQRRSIILPHLTNVRTNLIEQNHLVGSEIPDTNSLVLPPLITDWVECFDVMSQLAIKGLPIDFGLSDFLMNNKRIPSELNDYCALQTRTGSYLEALLLSVSSELLFEWFCTFILSNCTML